MRGHDVRACEGVMYEHQGRESRARKKARVPGTSLRRVSTRGRDVHGPGCEGSKFKLAMCEPASCEHVRARCASLRAGSMRRCVVRACEGAMCEHEKVPCARTRRCELRACEVAMRELGARRGVMCELTS